MSTISDADHETCGMAVAIDVVGGKWKLHLMWVLGSGPQPYSHIRRLLEGVSEKVLTENLRHLEAHGIIDREIFPEIPPRVQYRLTPLGEELRTALLSLETWGNKHRQKLDSQTRLVTFQTAADTAFGAIPGAQDRYEQTRQAPPA